MCGAVAWHSPRGGKPGKMEWRLCRPLGERFGRPTVLLLDHGVEKLSMIYEFRVLCFWLTLVLYLSQACLHFMAECLGEELMRSVALFPSPSWISVDKFFNSECTISLSWVATIYIFLNIILPYVEPEECRIQIQSEYISILFFSQRKCPSTKL
jgi:hypothetical protein